YGLTEQEVNELRFTGTASSILSARIAYLLNLKGPALAIDTACSSSLVAIAEACNSLILQTSDLALAGGVYVMAGPGLHIMTSKAGMLSEDGRCFTFDQRANGFVPGEGVGVVLLKRFSDAVRDGDPIHGVIRGWGINQDGKTNGITAPSANAQVLLEKDVYERFGISPETITLVETHGTATKLGDPIEVEALTKAFSTAKQKYCALGSVKSNIGHLSAAAGIAGVIKALLALKHQMLPPTIHFAELNEHISLDNTPFYINTQLQPWEVTAGKPRRAAVSSFGFSGTNAHLVIEEYISERESVKNNNELPCLFVLSARSEQQLKSYAQELKDWITAHTQLALVDMAFTLSQEILLQRLSAFIGEQPSTGVYTGLIKNRSKDASLFETDEDGQALLHLWCQQKKLAKVAQAWVSGLNVEWQLLYGEPLPHRINLPTYPFADERYWLPIAPAPAPNTPHNSTLHPLIQHNTSDFFAMRFSSTFRGDEFFLADHVVRGQRIMPGVVYLEMARAAVAQAMRIPAASAAFVEEGSMLRLSQIVWAGPLMVGASPLTVHITLTPQENGTISFVISQDAVNGVPYAQGTVEPGIQSTVQHLDLPAIQSRCQRRISASECYQRYRELSISYGPSLQGIEQLSVGEGEVLARLRLPATPGMAQPYTGGSTSLPYVLHPSMLDAALQACIGLQIVVPPEDRRDRACCRSRHRVGMRYRGV
ncbi:MAG: type I polyketide synthase, partial [Chloroflexi bacterium]